jgi:hypothetical protein
MKRKKHSPDQIIFKLREADALLNTGQSIGQACQPEKHWTQNKNNRRFMMVEEKKPKLLTQAAAFGLGTAAQSGDIERIKAKLEEVDIRAGEEEGTNVLISAIAIIPVHALRFLLEQGAKVNIVSSVSGTAPIHIVGFYFDIEKLKLLLEFGADVNLKTLTGRTPLDVLDSVYAQALSFRYEDPAGIDGRLEEIRSIINELIARGAVRGEGRALAYKDLTTKRGATDMEDETHSWSVAIAQGGAHELGQRLEKAGHLTSRTSDIIEKSIKADPQGVALVQLKGHDWTFVLFPYAVNFKEIRQFSGMISNCRMILAGYESTSCAHIGGVVEGDKTLEMWVSGVSEDDGFMFKGTFRKTRVTPKTKPESYFDRLLTNQNAYICRAELAQHETTGELLISGPFVRETVAESEYVVLKTQLEA